ncbi:LacI family DNA-binding transcriptional regulator [Alistipes sp. ZOR0009]|uniref:LacI family DNA-binding transcriptional regulator n=1 Tax=Alistipes sp. ZOR0009 TaxID=1339253 RepID=UPI0006472135|nr:LacI family DNA-binding transcriptional regulator [Alistipes sp. ZOR0009]
MKSNRVTIKDIARELGLSASTVSRALKDHPDISIETKKAVVELSQKLKYKPNMMALSLKNSKSNVVGVIIPELVHYFFSSVIAGIQEVADKHKIRVIVQQSNESYIKEGEALDAFADGWIDGLIISISKETSSYEHLDELELDGIPIVFFDRPIERENVDCVVFDDFKGAYDAVEYLIKQGRQSIAHFAGPASTHVGRERLKGYKKALENNGIAFNENLLLHADSFEKGFSGVETLISQNIPFDAIFTCNDYTAIGVLKALKKEGLSVPNQVAVVGFGDEDVSKMLDQPLTTVRQPGKEMGRVAMQTLLDKIGKKSTQEREHKLEANIVVRETA